MSQHWPKSLFLYRILYPLVVPHLRSHSLPLKPDTAADGDAGRGVQATAEAG